MNNIRKFWLLGIYLLLAIPLFSQNTYLELNLNNQAVQSIIRSFRPKSELDILKVIEQAGSDKKIRGIILNISSFDGSQDNLWELRNALEQFKLNGKKICAFISNADMDLYCLASVADAIVMDDLGFLSITGYAWGRAYVQQSLEKIGIGVRELRYFEYKSAVETFTRDSISEADREQYGEYLNDIFAVTRDTLMKARSWSSEEFDIIVNEEFLYSARSALEKGLVDRIGRYHAVSDIINALEGEEIDNFSIYGDNSSSLTGSLSNYSFKEPKGFFGRTPVIAVIYAEGQTDMEQGIAARSLSQTIRELADTKRFKAIVLRINSPGGSAEAADYIDAAVRYAKERKPVVVSMGLVAASGGYWAGMNANHITASPYTLTGSIGVISNWFFDKGLNNKLGLSVDFIQLGSHADAFAGFILPHRDLLPSEEDRYRNYILDIYSDFTSKVARGRNMEIERVESLAQGRVYSGIDAFDTGLIDSIGGLQDAILIARNLAEIPEGKKVIYREYPERKFFDRFLDTLLNVVSVLIPTKSHTAAFLSEFFFPQKFIADLRYRLERNGQAMPILPLGVPGTF